MLTECSGCEGGKGDTLLEGDLWWKFGGDNQFLITKKSLKIKLKVI